MTIIAYSPKGRALYSCGDIETEREAVYQLRKVVDALITLGRPVGAVALLDGSRTVWRKAISKFVERFILPRIQDQRAEAQEVHHAV